MYGSFTGLLGMKCERIVHRSPWGGVRSILVRVLNRTTTMSWEIVHGLAYLRVIEEDDPRALVDAWLEDRSVDPNSTIGHRGNVLHYAAYIDHLDAVEALLRDPRVDPDVEDPNGALPVYLCAHFGSLAVFKLLLRYARIDGKKRPGNVQGLLHASILNHSTDILQYLLDIKECDPNSRGDLGTTPLHLAVFENKTAAAKLLLNDRRTRINCLDFHGRSPIPVGFFTRPYDRFCVPPKMPELRGSVDKWTKRRIIDVCIGLRGLDLPVLQVLRIVDMDARQGAYAEYLPSMHVVWEWAKEIKKRKE